MELFNNWIFFKLSLSSHEFWVFNFFIVSFLSENILLININSYCIHLIVYLYNLSYSLFLLSARNTHTYVVSNFATYVQKKEFKSKLLRNHGRTCPSQWVSFYDSKDLERHVCANFIASRYQIQLCCYMANHNRNRLS